MAAKDSSRFPKLAQRVKELKTTEGGASAVCAVMEKYEKEAISKEKIKILKNMLNQGIPEDTAQKLAEASENELLRAKAECEKN